MRVLAPILLCVLGLIATVYLDDTPAEADLVFINRGDVFTLDPQRMSYLQDLRMAAALYEGVVSLDNEDCTIVPGVAKRWEVSDDGLTYTFHFREDAKWSNGDPVVASDFFYAWRRAITPDTAANYSGMFFVIDGAEAFFDWRAEQTEQFLDDHGDAPFAKRKKIAEQMWRQAEKRFAETVGLGASDPKTLIVTLSRPVAYFLDLLAFGVFSPVHPPTVERYVTVNADTGRLEQDHTWIKPGELVSNGPYELTHWRYKRDMIVEKNPYYWDRESVRSDRIKAIAMEDPNTAVLAYEAGGVDWVSDVTVEYRADMVAERHRYIEANKKKWSTLKASGHRDDHALAQLPAPDENQRRDIHVIPSFGTDFYGFNCREKLIDGRENPFADPRVRRAFVMSVDKQAIVSRVTRMNEPVATTFIPPGSIPGYDSPAGLAYDPQRARQELAEAGWVQQDGAVVNEQTGKAFPIVDLLYSTGSPRYRDISLALRDMWQVQLGVRVELRGKDTKFYRDDRKKGNFMISRGGWYGDYGDPTTFLNLCKTGDGNNHRGYSNPRFDKLLEQAAGERDPHKRMEMLEQAEAIIMNEDVPLLVLCNFVTVYMYEPGELVGLTHHPRLEQYLSEMSARE